jgi:hypothetical protein
VTEHASRTTEHAGETTVLARPTHKSCAPDLPSEAHANESQTRAKESCARANPSRTRAIDSLTRVLHRMRPPSSGRVALVIESIARGSDANATVSQLTCSPSSGRCRIGQPRRTSAESITPPQRGRGEGEGVTGPEHKGTGHPVRKGKRAPAIRNSCRLSPDALDSFSSTLHHVWQAVPSEDSLVTIARRRRSIVHNERHATVFLR